MNKCANDPVRRDAAVLRVRGALAFTDATKPGAGALADAARRSKWQAKRSESFHSRLRDSDRCNEAPHNVADIYNWFTKGFDTADSKKATALLEQLQG